MVNFAIIVLAIRTAIHASVFTVIVADASAKHTARMLYPWSTLTDGGLLLLIVGVNFNAVAICFVN